MSDPAQVLRDHQPSKEFFVGIDSDGCIFDSMEIKHKECFAPMFIKHWNLQAVSKYAREVWEFVNLYSKSRGCNRFPALISAIKFLGERPETQARTYPCLTYPHWRIDRPRVKTRERNLGRGSRVETKASLRSKPGPTPSTLPSKTSSMACLHFRW